ncbi:hypothetical protein BQ8794_60105 [Mesorhizobium prunaredense]|uniref:CHAT domain-containing protein n=1 Tax=Mesorhizobium prunaredense TaxID=1631249 RepID=A0A1R3VG12_9HYPH|nr:CHAT domain-containing protein [Mesorhizobium prunaredense]SIT58796.1 hypothetical protein BQ8794_60105 [Mesorhizobium prunaredense]
MMRFLIEIGFVISLSLGYTWSLAYTAASDPTAQTRAASARPAVRYVQYLAKNSDDDFDPRKDRYDPNPGWDIDEGSSDDEEGRPKNDALRQELEQYGKCTPDLFLSSLIQSDVYKWMMEHKEDLVFMPSDQAALREKEARLRIANKYLPDFYAGLSALSAHHKTLALIYSENWDDGPYTCVWLASSNGLVAYSPLASRSPVSDSVTDDDFLQLIWNALRVEVRSASRAPRKREGDDGCDGDTSGADIPLTQAQIDGEFSALAKAKSYLLPESISSALEKEYVPDARLLIIPARAAQKIPFAALPIGDRNLVDLFAPMIVPAAEDIIAAKPSNLRAAKKLSKASLPGFLVVGDPDLSYDKKRFCWPKLPHAREEASFLASKLGVGATVGASANFNFVKSSLKAGQNTLRLIYFATHGITDPINPADGSFLALDGNHLTGAALRKMKLKFSRHPVVVMSACFSGLGKVFPGGVFGLSDFWLGAGASQVVVSLWAVSDAGTRDLMGLFATELSKRFALGAPSTGGAEIALAVAMRELKSKEKDPAIWSAFVVIGRPAP